MAGIRIFATTALSHAAIKYLWGIIINIRYDIPQPDCQYSRCLPSRNAGNDIRQRSSARHALWTYLSSRTVEDAISLAI